MQYTRMTLTGATGSKSSEVPLFGHIDYVEVTYADGGVGGTLTLTDDQSGIQFLSRSDSTNLHGALRRPAIDTGGSNLAGTAERLPVMSTVTAVWANHAVNTVITVEIWWV